MTYVHAPKLLDRCHVALACQPREAIRLAAAQIVIDALFFWQTEHCKAAYFAEYERSQLPGEYRK